MSKIPAADDLSIGAVASRTGVSPSVLRAWERRHGFPAPARLVGGHRRYSPADLSRIEVVLRERKVGRSLERAIEIATRPGRQEHSLFAGVRRARPDLQVRVLSRRSMLAISRAIEDECCAQADAALLLGAFQHEGVYRRAEVRWTDLARTTRQALVFADFNQSRSASDGPDEVAVPTGSPLVREWAVVCDGPGSAACLMGWERQTGEGFEALWSVDPSVVRQASQIGIELARHHAPDLAIVPVEVDDDPVLDPADALRRAEAVTNRVIAYLDGGPGALARVG